MIPIKTKDLCARCEYAYERCAAFKSCDDCAHKDKDDACLCLKVRKNTPCPYFKEGEANETD